MVFGLRRGAFHAGYSGFGYERAVGFAGDRHPEPRIVYELEQVGTDLGDMDEVESI